MKAKFSDYAITLFAIVLFVFIIYIGIKFVGFAWAWLTRPKPYCYYEWIDVNGIEGTSSLDNCVTKFDSIYCGNAEEAHLISTVKKVCK